MAIRTQLAWQSVSSVALGRVGRGRIVEYLHQVRIEQAARKVVYGLVRRAPAEGSFENRIR
jgi:hypothetical protein